MKHNLLKQFNLPGYIKGKSFAEASKAIDKKFKDRQDIHSKATKESLLKKLSEAQEFLKGQNNQMSDINEKAYGGYQNKMFLGGAADLLKTPGINGEADGGDIAGSEGGALGKVGPGGYMSAATTALELGKEAFGPTGIDTSGLQKADKVNVGAGVAGSALKGASAGMAFGPIGAGVGALVGGVAGLIGGNKAKKDANKANARNSLYMNNEYKDMAQGGFMNDPRIDYKAIDKTFNKIGVSDDASLAGAQELNYANPTNQNNIGSKIGEGLNKTGKFLKNNYGDILRYSPVAANAYQLATLAKPQQENLERLSGNYKKSFLDTETLTNKIQNEYNNTSRALTEASGGSGSTLRANLLGAQLNKTKSISDAYSKAAEVNRNEDRYGQQFDLNIKNTNLSQSNQEKDINARNQAAYDNNKSKLISQIGNDLGNIGKEEVSKKQIKKLFGYDWMGRYVKNNPKASKSDIQKAFKEEINKINPTKDQASYGGYLKKRK